MALVQCAGGAGLTKFAAVVEALLIFLPTSIGDLTVSSPCFDSKIKILVKEVADI